MKSPRFGFKRHRHVFRESKTASLEISPMRYPLDRYEISHNKSPGGEDMFLNILNSLKTCEKEIVVINIGDILEQSDSYICRYIK